MNADAVARRVVTEGTTYLRFVSQSAEVVNGALHVRRTRFEGVRLGQVRVERDPFGFWLLWPNRQHPIYRWRAVRLDPSGPIARAFDAACRKNTESMGGVPT